MQGYSHLPELFIKNYNWSRQEVRVPPDQGVLGVWNGYLVTRGGWRNQKGGARGWCPWAFKESSSPQWCREVSETRFSVAAWLQLWTPELWLLCYNFVIKDISISSITQSCPTLCYPMNRSIPGLPVHHQLVESTQTHVHWVSDAIQPSHPLSFTSPSALNLAQNQGLFQWVSSSHQVAKVLEFQLQHHSFQWIFRTDFL